MKNITSRIINIGLSVTWHLIFSLKLFNSQWCYLCNYSCVTFFVKFLFVAIGLFFAKCYYFVVMLHYLFKKYYSYCNLCMHWRRWIWVWVLQSMDFYIPSQKNILYLYPLPITLRLVNMMRQVRVRKTQFWGPARLLRLKYIIIYT